VPSFSKRGLKKRKVKAVVYGLGVEGKTMTKLMVEKGVDIPVAIDVDLNKVCLLRRGNDCL
jgi:hypothetical protein